MRWGSHLIKINNLRKSYYDNHVLDNITMELKNNNIYALIGKNGSGKTTFLNSIASDLFKDTGTIYIDGISHEDFDSKYRLFYISDKKNILSNWTGFEYLNFISKTYLKKQLAFNYTIDKYINDFDLKKHLDKRFENCSFGTKQKFFILGAIISNCNNIILDEPFNGLDPTSSEHLRSILKMKALDGHMVLFTSHSLDLISNFSDVILFLNDGNVYSYNNNDFTYNELYDIYLRVNKNI